MYVQKNAEGALKQSSELKKWKRPMAERAREKVRCANRATRTIVLVSCKIVQYQYSHHFDIGYTHFQFLIYVSTTKFTVNGGWGDFDDWEQCPEPCGGAQRSRYRECDNPSPQYGGVHCAVDGSTNVETETCNENKCRYGRYI